MMTFEKIHSHLKSRGFITMTSTVVLLFVMTLIGIFGARTAIMEQKAANNEYQAKQSFEAAEAGMEYGGVNLEGDKVAILTDADSNGYLDSYSNTNTSNVSQTNGTTYTITYRNPVVSKFNIIEVTSIGRNFDGAVTRTIKQMYANVPYISSTPPGALIAKGDVDISGNLTIANTVNGDTIWAGGAVSITGSATTDDGSGGSSSSGKGSDITENDAGLAGLSSDDFFQKFFGEDMATTKGAADTFLQASTDTNYSGTLDGKKAELVWIEHSAGEARMTSNSVIGSAEHPVILVVDADLKIAGTTVVYGVVYVARNLINDGGGTLTVHGSVIVDGNMSGTGTPDVIYNENIFDKLQETVGKYTKIPGSWIDM